MFRVGGMSESQQETITFKKHDPQAFRRMLEFLYTDAVTDLDSCDAGEVLALLMLANEFLIQKLADLCEGAASRVISAQNVTKFLLLSSTGGTSSVLRQACAKFVHDNIGSLIGDYSFRSEVETCPELGLLLFEASVATSGSEYGNSQESYGSSSGRYDSHKRRRVTGELSNSQIEPDRAASNTIAHNNANVGQD